MSEIMNSIENTTEQAVVTCACCGVIIEDEDSIIRTADGDTICQDCYDREYFTCEDCGDVFHTDDAVEVEITWRGATRMVCSDCAERDYVQCTDCGGWYAEDLISMHDDYHDICHHCADEWCECEQCGRVITSDDAYYDDDSGEYLCEDCRDETLDSYSYKPDPVFGTTDENDGRYFYHGSDITMGVELEIDKGRSVRSCLSDMRATTDRAYFKHDGSLSDGIEIVTHPGTLAWHMERFPWARMCEIGINHGFKSHDAGTCGLHVHVGREQLGEDGDSYEIGATIGKLILTMDRLWDELWCFSRRASEQWCARTAVLDSLTDSTTTEQALKLARKRANRDRYVALNLYNDETIEFRLFRGTLKKDTVIATLQLVWNLCHFCMDHTAQECIDSVWGDVQHYREWDELNGYVADRFAGITFPEKAKSPVLESVPPHEWVIGDQFTYDTRTYTIMDFDREFPCSEVVAYSEYGSRYYGTIGERVAERHGIRFDLTSLDDAVFVQHFDVIPEEYRYHPPVPAYDFRIGDRVRLNASGRHVNPDTLCDRDGTVVAISGEGEDVEVCVAWDEFTSGHNGPFFDTNRSDCWYVAARRVEHVTGQFDEGDHVRIVDASQYDGVNDSSNVYVHSTGVGVVVRAENVQALVAWQGMEGNGNGSMTAEYRRNNLWWTRNECLILVDKNVAQPMFAVGSYMIERDSEGMRCGVRPVSNTANIRISADYANVHTITIDRASSM